MPQIQVQELHKLIHLIKVKKLGKNAVIIRGNQSSRIMELINLQKVHRNWKGDTL